jgi:hypothetical protein
MSAFTITNESESVNNFTINMLKEREVPNPSQFWCSDWIESMLRTSGLNNLPPTVCARWCMIVSNVLYNSYAFVSGLSPVDSNNPSGHNYWPSTKNAASYVSIQTWMESVCQWFFPILLQTWMPYSISPHVSPNPSFHQLDSSYFQHLISTHTPLQTMDNISLQSLCSLKSAISTYMTNRQNDGWLRTFTFNTSYNNNANLSNVIDGSNLSQQNLNTLPNHDKWTPVRVNGVTQAYTTPEWGAGSKDPSNVTNFGILSEVDTAFIQASAQSFFPDPTTKAAIWQKEIEKTYRIIGSLNDEQKMITEYFCQGTSGISSTGTPLYGTVSPSGTWMVWVDVFMRSNQLSIGEEIRYYMVIANGLYEASINAWKLKRTNLQPRPIQSVRQYLYNPTNNIDVPIHQDWNPSTPNQQTGSGSYWLPYQLLGMVTPSFPDFVSGHATFGATVARLMNYLTGTDQIVLPIPITNLDIVKYTSQTFSGNDAAVNSSILNVFCPPGCSSIQPSPGFNGNVPVPLSGLYLEYSTWTQMANSNANSRLYGGVHWDSSDQAGLRIGNQIGDKLWLLYKDT